jgi:death-on-curing protein
VDGNKRTGFLAMYAFLYRNNLQLEVDEMEAAEKIESLAAGPLDETELTDWLRANTKQIT